MIVSRRRLITSSVIALACAPTLARAVTARTLLQGPTDFWCGPGGSLGNTGLSPAQALPTAQDVANLLYSAYDFSGQQAGVRLLSGAVDPGVRFSGSMVGQRGLTGLVLRADAGFGTATIQPANQGCCVAADSEAMLSIADLILDGSVQGAAGKPQDLVQAGQDAHLAFYGTNRTIQRANSYNAFTAVASTIDFMPQSWGSTVQNGGHLYVQGIHQDYIQTDQGAQVHFVVNDNHGLFELKCESNPMRSKPYCGVAWLDVADGVILVSGVDASNGVGGDGYKVRYRKFGTIDFGLPVNPNDFNNFISNAGAPNTNNYAPGLGTGGVI